MPVAQDGPLGDGGAGRGDRRGGGHGGGLRGLELLGLDLDAAPGVGEDLLHDGDGGVGAHARPVGRDEHRQVEAGYRDPVLVALLRDEAGDLVEGGASPQVHQEQHVLLVREGGDRVKQLLVHVVGAHVRRQDHGRHVFLRTEDHASRLLDALGEPAVAGENYADHPTSSFANLLRPTETCEP